MLVVLDVLHPSSVMYGMCRWYSPLPGADTLICIADYGSFALDLIRRPSFCYALDPIMLLTGAIRARYTLFIN